MATMFRLGSGLGACDTGAHRLQLIPKLRMFQLILFPYASPGLNCR